MCSPDVGGFEDPSAMAADVNRRLQYDSPLLRTQIVGHQSCFHVQCLRERRLQAIVLHLSDCCFARRLLLRLGRRIRNSRYTMLIECRQHGLALMSPTEPRP
jgi:hypothetical protein